MFGSMVAFSILSLQRFRYTQSEQGWKPIVLQLIKISETQQSKIRLLHNFVVDTIMWNQKVCEHNKTKFKCTTIKIRSKGSGVTRDLSQRGKLSWRGSTDHRRGLITQHSEKSWELIVDLDVGVYTGWHKKTAINKIRITSKILFRLTQNVSYIRSSLCRRHFQSFKSVLQKFFVSLALK